MSNGDESLVDGGPAQFYFLILRQFGIHVFLTIVTIFVMFGGIVPYVFQYREIYRSQNPRGFSLYVCLALLVANILRITFWFGKRFEYQLLIQSFVMISCMLSLIELSVRLTRKYSLPPNTFHSVWEGNLLTHFWHWSDFSSYLVCIVVFIAVTTCIGSVCIHSLLFTELIGFAALMTEALLGTPQFLSNYYRRSTVGMSLKMVLMWLTGDISKTIYFMIRKTPSQFSVCGCVQISVDIAILSQVAYYRHFHQHHSPSTNSPASPAISVSNPTTPQLGHRMKQLLPNGIKLPKLKTNGKSSSLKGLGLFGHRHKNSGSDLKISNGAVHIY